MKVTKEKLLAFVTRPFSRRLGLRFELDDTNRLYRELIAEAEKTKTPDKIQDLYGEWSLDSALIEEELRQLETRRLVNRAHRLLLPVPEIPVGKTEDDNWIRGTHLRVWYLKPEGFSRMRALIRAETKERREAFVTWATLIIGIIGALIGLVAVCRR